MSSLRLLMLNMFFMAKLTIALSAIGAAGYGGWQLRGVYEASPVKTVIQFAGLNK